MTDARPIPPERLLEETRWLRALAASLAHGDADADDLAQSAWLRALEQKPGAIRGLRPWLAAVLRHATFRIFRDDQARSRRESTAARPEAIPSPAELAGRASLHRAVVEAVLALDEPHRSTVLLRYFEGLKPGEIARAQGVPVETVRTRLKRALATLRSRLDEERGGRAAWAVFATSAAIRFAAAGSTVAGVLVVSSKTKIALSVAAGILLLIAGNAIWRAEAERSRSTLASTAAQSPGPESSPATQAATPPPPVLAQESRATDPLPQPAEAALIVRVHVSDEDGNDIPGALVTITADFPVATTTDAQGLAQAFLPGPRVATILVSAAGFANRTFTSVAIVSGTTVEVDLARLTTLRIAVQDPDGGPIAGATVQIESQRAYQAAVPPPDYVRLLRVTGDDGIAVFVEVPAVCWELRVHASGFVDSAPPRGTASSLRTCVSDTTVVLPRGADIVVRFVDATSGEPVPRVEAVVHPDSKRIIDAMLVADENGVMRIGRPPDATTRIDVMGDHVSDPLTVQIPPDQSYPSIRVSTAKPVFRRVVREDGTEVQWADLEYAQPHRVIPVVAQDGLFEVPGQKTFNASSYRFLIPGAATPWVRSGPISPDVFTLIARPEIPVRGQIVDGQGAPVAGAFVRVDAHGILNADVPTLYPRQFETTTQSDARGVFAFTARGSPYYLIEVTTDHGTVAQHFVAASSASLDDHGVRLTVPLTKAPADGGVCDVGRIVVATATGGLRMTVDIPGPGGFEVLVSPQGSAEGSFPARRAPVRSNRKAEIAGLPEGDYLLEIVPRSGGKPFPFGARGTRARVTAGAVTEVTVTR